MSDEIPVTPTPTTPNFRRPHDGKVLLGFSMRPDGGGHDGIDFAANLGDMVRASSSGTVISAGAEPTRFGRMVVIDHGNGWHSVYGHLARVTVTTGDVVKGGERIGIAGDAGDAARVELHFEIRRNEVPVDPAPKLPTKRR
jgi:murein DD-endopeptidase MepM/ murein hydrolase activator NlpD